MVSECKLTIKINDITKLPIRIENSMIRWNTIVDTYKVKGLDYGERLDIETYDGYLRIYGSAKDVTDLTICLKEA